MKLRLRAALLPLCACVVLGALASPALAAAPRTFVPRVGNALGLIPPVNSQGNFNTEPTETGVFTPVVYHGGPTMNQGVAVHTIFWAPSAFPFQGAPTGSLSYEAMIEQFYTDVAAASTGTSGGTCTTSSCDDFTVEPQYGNEPTPSTAAAGENTITFNNVSQTFSGSQTLNPADSVILDTDPYPASGNAPGECTSPQDTKACVLDSVVQSEVDSIVQHTTGTPRGLTNLWYVFFPSDVDECIVSDVCGTNDFGGYHSLSNVGHGLTIYAITIDPTIEVGSIAQGADPEGNPDAEVAVDIANHETNEAMTDPTGIGWMDPNGYEVADKCEFGPQHGTPLGFATDGSPYNQVINGDKYYDQEIWSQNQNECVQATTDTSDPLPLPQVNLNQFSSTVSGNTENNSSTTGVTVTLVRTDINGNTIDITSPTVTTASGAWTATLPGSHAVGDDRDEIDIDYSGGNLPSVTHQVILTGNGGNPFTESGWTGWTDLDNGYALTNSDPVTTNPSITIGPCFQTGPESVGGPVGTVGGITPTDFCSTSGDTADDPLTGTVTPADAETITTNDNRAFQPNDASTNPSVPGAVANANGGLVSLTIPAGEPDSTSLFDFPLGAVTGVPFTQTGFPTCSADLGAQTVTCTGLVAGDVYTIADGAQTDQEAADATGTVTSTSLTVSRNDTITLTNSAPRTLTTLHVANLQVSIDDANPGAVVSGTCTPDEWTGGPLNGVPVNTEAGGPGIAGVGAACPSNGDASGMSTSALAQTDEQSGGQTVITLPDVADTSPMEGETVYGGFTALSESTGAPDAISVSIAKASGGAPVFTNANTDTANGAAVPALTPGAYNATWTVTDRQRRHEDPDHAVHRAVRAPGSARAARAARSAGRPGSAGTTGPAGTARTSGAEAQDLVQAGQAQQDRLHGDVPEGQQQEGHAAGQHQPRWPPRGPRQRPGRARSRDADDA